LVLPFVSRPHFLWHSCTHFFKLDEAPKPNGRAASASDRNSARQLCASPTTLQVVLERGRTRRSAATTRARSCESRFGCQDCTIVYQYRPLPMVFCFRPVTRRNDGTGPRRLSRFTPLLAASHKISLSLGKQRLEGFQRSALQRNTCLSSSRCPTESA
jgi:hypothetical protein